MKKILLIFMLIDFAFIGLVLTLSKKNSRSIANDSTTESSPTDDLTEGQKKKWALVETFQFKVTTEQIEFTTDKLQIICDTSALIELRFSAQNVAVAGAQPSVSHIFSCDEIKKDLSRSTLTTSIEDFKKMHSQKVLSLQGSELRSSLIYSDEDFPKTWRLTDVKISGPSSFTINEFEIEKTLIKNFDFEITSVK